MEKEKFDFYSKTAIKSYNLDERIRYQLKMLDGLDAFTRVHSENVANLTCRLCEKLKLPTGFIIYCTTCAYIHDVGKLYIPPSILQKPTMLTDEEYEIMKTHTTIGYKSCMEDLKLRPYAAGPMYHHEALDGTGYPSGLKGNKIPYEGQIIKVADEFDAMVAKRQYKTHVGISDTLRAIIEEVYGGKLDRQIVKVLLKVVIDDIEYEIAARIEYVDYLKTEIKRVQEAFKYYEKWMGAGSETKKEYYKQGVEMYLRVHEVAEKCPEMLAEFKEAYKVRKKHIDSLYDEVSIIKNLVV